MSSHYPRPSPPGVCLATILDSSRLPSLLLLRGAWHGELSAAVLARAGEPLEAQRAWLASAIALELSLLARERGEKRYRVVDGRVVESRGAETRTLLLENTGFDCPHRFPYNVLRNLAFFACRSEFVLSLDVNIVPLPSSPEGYRELQRLVANAGAQSAAQRQHSVAWILPVFEITPLGEERVWQGATTLHRKAAFRSTSETAKHELKKMVRDQIAAPFYSGSRDRSATSNKAPAPPKRRPRREPSDAEPDLLQPTNLSFHKAYKCTDHVRWLQLPRHAHRSSYYTARHCTGHFEPFVIVHKGIFLQPTADAAAPRKYARQPFDTSFVRGFDKVSFTYELFARNVTFLVAPSHFLMHLPTAAEENTMAPAAVASRAVRRSGVRSEASSSSSSSSTPSFSSFLIEQPLPSSPHRFRRHGTGSSRANSQANGSSSHSPSKTTCTIEPVQEWIRPFAGMPGWTCIDSFLLRMAKEHAYSPHGSDHGVLRRWASRWRGRCHTRADHMEELFRDGAGPRGAASTTASADDFVASQHTTTAKPPPRAPPAAIGMPPRVPQVVEAVGNFDHATMRHLAAYSLNVKRAGYLRGGDCYGLQNLNFSCWAVYLAGTCKRDDVDGQLLGSLGMKRCVHVRRQQAPSTR